MDVLIINSIESLGILVIKNILINNNISADYFVDIDSNTIIKKILEVKPKILAISWNFDCIIYDVLINLPYLKQHLPNLKIAVGGYGATNDLDNLREYPLIDLITVGETDDIIADEYKLLLQTSIKSKLPKVVIPTALPDLINYDYDNNLLVKNDVIYTMTARNCIKGKNRCWYCTCATTGLRPLDLEKVIASIKKKITPKTKQIVLADAEVLSKTVNRLWNEFHIPISCFMLAKDLVNLDPTVINSHFIVGVDYYIPGKNGNFIDGQIVNAIKKCSVKNKISISSVYSEKYESEEREKTFTILRRLSENNPNIDVTFPKLVMYPGTDGINLEKNIYLNKINFSSEFTDIGVLGNYNTNGQDQISFTTWEEAFDIT